MLIESDRAHANQLNLHLQEIITADNVGGLYYQSNQSLHYSYNSNISLRSKLLESNLLALRLSLANFMLTLMPLQRTSSL